MPYFNTRDVAAIAICASLWGILNSIFGPVFFSIFHLPFFCDMVGFSVLILATWWIRKFGAIALIGGIATLITFALAANPYHFLGFTVASFFFDLALAVLGFEKAFSRKAATFGTMMTVSIASAALAGYIIGSFFIAGPVLTAAGGSLGWAGLHAIGGIIGGIIGTSLLTSLSARKVTVNNRSTP